MSDYVCRSCERVVDPDQEPSPGEPVRCADCYSDLLREGWGDW